MKPLPPSQGLQFVNLMDYSLSTSATHLTSGGGDSGQPSPDVETKVRAVVAQKMAALGLSNNTTNTISNIPATAAAVAKTGTRTAHVSSEQPSKNNSKPKHKLTSNNTDNATASK